MIGIKAPVLNIFINFAKIKNCFLPFNDRLNDMTFPPIYCQKPIKGLFINVTLLKPLTTSVLVLTVFGF